MKRRSFLETLIKKAGLLTDEELKAVLEDQDGELDDGKANAVLAALLTADEAIGNDAIFSKVKGKHRAEALDPIDNMLKEFEGELTAAQKAEYARLGKDTHKRYQFMLKAFKEQKTPTGNANYDELKADYDRLKTQLETDYVAKSELEQSQSKVSEKQRALAHAQILLSAIKSGKLKDVSADRHFERNFIADAQELLDKGIGDKKQKGVIDYETGRIMRADSPDQPLLIGGEAATLATLADLTMTAYDYVKKGEPSPAGSIQLPANPSGSNVSPMVARMLEMDKEE